MNIPKQAFTVLITILFLGSPEMIFSQFEQNSKIVVVIDPGHGGKDIGALGTNRIAEKEVVLKIAKEMVNYNQSLHENAIEIYLTRSTDTLISLVDRTKLPKSLNADLFISLHCNHSVDPLAKGIEVYVSQREGEHAKEAIYLAYSLQKALSKNLGYKSRGVKFADFQVLRETAGQVPAILIELGYLSNPDEARHMGKEVNIHAIALTILQSLNHYKMSNNCP